MPVRTLLAGQRGIHNLHGHGRVAVPLRYRPVHDGNQSLPNPLSGFRLAEPDWDQHAADRSAGYLRHGHIADQRERVGLEG